MAHVAIWCISALSIALMLFRPFGVPEFVWTTAGALLLCVLRLIPLRLAGHAVAEGMDVYLFLTGMMLLSELAKTNGVFDWLANIAVKRANGSSRHLFTLIYGVGTVVTIFMSNDATAVVLTPAVLSAVKHAKAKPMPYLLTCAMIANAASFVLPISNPANLVVFRASMPPLMKWLAMFIGPSIISIIATYFLLRWFSRNDLDAPCDGASVDVKLTSLGKVSLFGIFAVAGVLLIASALKVDLGLPTCVAALVVASLVLIMGRSNPVRLVREISWTVLPLVAALFVIVEAVKSAGALQMLQAATEHATQWPRVESGLALAVAVGFGTNLVNNLPLGLIAGATLHSMTLRPLLSQAVLIGIDLGPNLSITGSLATILWLIAIRREGMHVSAWQFLKAGMLIMPISLVLAIGGALLFGGQ
ncbi:arsenic transporter [Telmatobacter sp. DSM 110680]|uniref:Arsenic transporter n=1 Tax=Telmatobacter sp. DSM 110680 TaxID=3036704 RepID=A0AAU7DHS2_9BACT